MVRVGCVRRPSGRGCDASDAVWCDGRSDRDTDSERTLTGSTQLAFGARSENELRLVLARRTKSRVLPAAQCYRSPRRKLTRRPLFTHSGQRPSGRGDSSSFSLLRSSFHPSMLLYVFLHVFLDFRSDTERKLQSLNTIIPVT